MQYKHPAYTTVNPAYYPRVVMWYYEDLTAINVHVHIGDNTYDTILSPIIIEHNACPDLLINTYNHHTVALCYRLGI